MINGYNNGGFAGGLASGLQSGMAMADFIKQQQLENDLADASKSQLEEVPGADGAASTWKLGDQTYAQKPQDHQTDLDKSNMLAKVYEAHGKPDRAIALRAGANQNFKLAQESAIDKEMTDLAASTPYAQITKANDAKKEQYAKETAAYTEALKSGDPVSAGLPPVAPTYERPTYLDTLSSVADQLAVRRKHGKMDVNETIALGKEMDSVKKEGTTDALQALHAGDVKGAIEKWNANGDHKINPADVTPREVMTDVNGTKVKTFELTVKNPDGTVSVINAAKGLQAIDKIDKTVSMTINAHQDSRAGAAAGREATNFSQAQGDRKDMIAARTAVASQQFPNITDPAIVRGAGLGLDLKPMAQTQAQTANFAADNPTARPDQSALVAAGLPNDANVSVDRSVRGALAVQNNPGATPTTIDAIKRGIDPTHGNEGAKGKAAAELYKQRFPDATPEETRAAQLGIIKVEDGMTSSFTPNQMLGGGTIQQKDRHGNIWVTDVSPKGEYSETRYVAAPVIPGAAAKPGAKPGAKPTADKNKLKYEEGTVVNLKNGGKGVVEKVDGELKIRPF